jgi:uncharacterized protein (DUF362 family)
MNFRDCSGEAISRRYWLAAATGAPAFLNAAASLAQAAPTQPSARVAVARCGDYGASLVPSLETMFDQLGGLGGLVRGKTVGIKINMTGGPRERVGYTPCESAQYTHPGVIGAVVALMGKAGARRVRILEGCFACADPLEEFMLEAGWDPSPLLSAAPRVEMENTNVAGRARKYSRLMTPGGGYIFRGFDFNHSYVDCDVFVSLAKLKEHKTAGVTLSIKNCFGCSPISIYGDAAGVDEPNEEPRGGRGAVMHAGARQPAKSAIAENDPTTPRNDKYRIPRIITDIVGARPVHLAIIDGIHTMSGGEGPWTGRVAAVRPGVLIAGTNCVSTDAVGTAVMGFDPMADRGKAPFETCDSTLRLAEDKGLGTRDLGKIELVGVPIKEVTFDFRKSWNA